MDQEPEDRFEPVPLVVAEAVSRALSRPGFKEAWEARVGADSKIGRSIMETSLTLSIAEFTDQVDEVVERLEKHEISELILTREGKPVAVLHPSTSRSEALAAWYGSMKGMVIIPEGFDLTAPVLDEPMDAELGILHR